METVIVIFLITRFFFLAGFPHFFDSPEYLLLSQEKNLAFALAKSHESLHPIYILFIQISSKLYNSITSVSFISAFFGTLAFFTFYILIKRLFNKKIALLSLIPLTFFPHIWLIQTNIMHESMDHFFLLASFLFFDLLLTSKKFFYLFFCFFVYILALVNFSGNLIWTPVFFGVYFFRKYKN